MPIDKIEHVSATVNTDNIHDINNNFPLVLKKLHQGPMGTELASDYVDDWKNFTLAGIRTIPLIDVYDEHTIVMTDLTADGSMFYGKDMVLRCFQRFKEGRTTEMDRQFLTINPNEIIESAEVAMDAANNANLFLPIDDPFDILVHPDGSWEVLTVDLSRRNTSDSAQINNAKSVDKLKSYVTWMRGGLTGTVKQPIIVP